MKALLLALALALVACVTPRPALDSATASTSVMDLTLAVRIAAAQCGANARHLDRFDPKRSEALTDACMRALIPARDAVVFVLPAAERWTTASSAAVGCAGKAVRVGLEKVQAAFGSAGYASTPALAIGIGVGRRLEPYALDTCDPLHPTTERSTTVDPNIPRVEPDYP